MIFACKLYAAMPMQLPIVFYCLILIDFAKYTALGTLCEKLFQDGESIHYSFVLSGIDCHGSSLFIS